jgi:hypothetical protein
VTRLREHFADLADQAKQYDVTETVVRRARRRRHLERLAPAAAGVVLLVGALAWGSAARGPAPTETSALPVVDAAGEAVRRGVDRLPPIFSVSLPEPDLPVDHGVGRAALVYHDGDRPYQAVLLPDGSAYRAPHAVSSLSPDGRWLAYGPEGDLRLRDLTGTAELRLGAVSPIGWSPDGASVLLQSAVPDAGNPDRVEVLEPRTGERHTIPVHDPDIWAPIGLLSSGDLLLSPRGARPGPADPSPDSTPGPAPELGQPTWGPGQRPGAFLAVADAVTGEQRGLPVAAPAERDEIGSGPAMPALPVPGRDTVLIQLLHRTGSQGGVASYLDGDLLEVSADTGEAVRRIRLPEPSAERELTMVTAGRDGVLLVRHDGSDPAELELLDIDSGTRRIVTTLAPGVSVLVPGGRAYH